MRRVGSGTILSLRDFHPAISRLESGDHQEFFSGVNQEIKIKYATFVLLLNTKRTERTHPSKGMGYAPEHGVLTTTGTEAKYQTFFLFLSD